MDTRMTHASVEVAAEPLSDSALDSLREAFRGELIRPIDPGYEEARQVWNGVVDRRPAIVARCTGTADVVAAVRFARAEGLEIAVRGGGHSVAGHGTVNGGLVIDLSPMRGVRVDPDARRAWVQGGAMLGQLDHETALHGLATTAGTVSHTGVGGLTLGGGYGFLARTHGLAADNLASVEVVTAGGEVLTASDSRNPDLFWGLRGGGGNFGIATGFEFRLHPAAPIASTGDLFFHADDGLAALRTLQDFAPQMPEAMTIEAGAVSVRQEWEMPELEVGAPMVVISWVYLGSRADGRRIAEPLYAGLKPRAEMGEEMSYLHLQGLADASQRHGLRRYWKGSFATVLPDAGLEAFIARGAKPGDPAPLWNGELISLGGAVARVGEEDTAYSGRDAVFDFLSLSSWEDPAEDEVRLAGARHYWETMTPFTSARAYVNSLEAEGTARVRDAYGASKYDRLVALKRKYDPDNVFHLNQNIRP
ncbi:MAG: FAD-binding oxidoreductase [Candidatus Limnocylindria bacterium]